MGRRQIDTPEFKRWYGDWQNAGGEATQTDTAADGALLAGERAGDLRALRGSEDVGATADRRDVQIHLAGGAATFNGASGPTGEGGTPLRLYHGTREDIAPST